MKSRRENWPESPNAAERPDAEPKVGAGVIGAPDEGVPGAGEAAGAPGAPGPAGDAYARRASRTLSRKDASLPAN